MTPLLIVSHDNYILFYAAKSHGRNNGTTVLHKDTAEIAAKVTETHECDDGRGRIEKRSNSARINEREFQIK